MFVCNLKVNGNRLYKIFFIVLISLSILLFVFSIYNIITSISNKDTYLVNDEIPIDDISELSSSNYTNVLKQVHDNLDEYIGRQICFVGYVYRIDELSENQFILARNMIINSASQSVVVGFLCEYEQISDFEDYEWVKVTGCIQKGYFNGDIPLIEVTDIEVSSKPEDEFVYPPDDTYIPTSVLY